MTWRTWWGRVLSRTWSSRLNGQARGLQPRVSQSMNRDASAAGVIHSFIGRNYEYGGGVAACFRSHGFTLCTRKRTVQVGANPCGAPSSEPGSGWTISVAMRLPTTNYSDSTTMSTGPPSSDRRGRESCSTSFLTKIPCAPRPAISSSSADSCCPFPMVGADAPFL